uniref:Netrin receptor UNC5 n=1 Tax=Trichuris muris TaxID=70415 RepID=A0A5S6QZS3_TRIMR
MCPLSALVSSHSVAYLIAGGGETAADISLCRKWRRTLAPFEQITARRWRRRGEQLAAGCPAPVCLSSRSVAEPMEATIASDQPNRPPPVLIETPNDAYLIRGRHQQTTVTLTCRAVHADRISFKCNGLWIPDALHERREGVDSASGVPFVQTSVAVSRQAVERFRLSRGSDYACECYAFGASTGEMGVQVKSQPATVRVAYMLKDFYREPASEKRPLGSLVEMPCLPPEGEPVPEVFWLKDGVEIVSRKDPNVIVANDGSLLISAARLSDSGNYTCGARNIVNERLTEPASLHVYVNGQWSQWGPWEGVCPTSCDVFANSRHPEAKLTRYRHCNNPVPANGGLPCPGEAKEQVDCNLSCPVDGDWSAWSRWSECQSDCRRQRRRVCDNPPPRHGGQQCHGADRQWRTCSDLLCSAVRRVDTSPSQQLADKFDSKGGGNNVAMYAGLGAAFFAFIIAFAFVFAVMLRRRTCRRCAKDYEAAPSPPMHSCMAPPDTISKKMSHHRSFEPPPTLNSERSRNGLITWSQKSDSSAIYYPNTSEDNNYATVDDSRMDYEYSADRISLVSTNASRYTAANPNSSGHCILLKNHAISLFVPEGALSEGEHMDLSLVCTDECAPLSDLQTMITPVIWFHSNRISVLKKPAVLSIEHSALLPSSNSGSQPRLDDWQFSCLVSEELPYEGLISDWTVAAVIGQETLNSDVYCQVESRFVHILVESFGKLVLVGQPKHSSAQLVKRTKLLAFFGDGGCLRLYCAADTRTTINWITDREEQLGGRLCGVCSDVFPVNFYKDVHFRIESVGSGWTIPLDETKQNITPVRLQSGCPQAVNCNFKLNMLGEQNSFKGRVRIYQTMETGDGLLMDVDTEAWWDVSDCYGNFFPAIRLAQPIKLRLSSLLDPPLETGNDWRMLAHLLAVDHYLPYFASRPSPTELILTLWESREQNVHGFVKLLHFLRRMKRQDACAVLSAYLNNL